MSTNTVRDISEYRHTNQGFAEQDRPLIPKYASHLFKDKL